MKTVEVGSSGRGYSIFGVSRTNKGVLAMRGTTPDKLAARMAVFRRDGDTCVTLVDLQRVQHKTEAARQLGNSSWFLDQCVKNGLDRAEVLSFLQGVAGQATAVPVMPSAPVEEVAQIEEVAQVEEVAQQVEEVAQQVGAAELLDQLEQTEQPEESVAASRKSRRRR